MVGIPKAAISILDILILILLLIMFFYVIKIIFLLNELRIIKKPRVKKEEQE